MIQTKTMYEAISEISGEVLGTFTTHEAANNALIQDMYKYNFIGYDFKGEPTAIIEDMCFLKIPSKQALKFIEEHYIFGEALFNDLGYEMNDHNLNAGIWVQHFNRDNEFSWRFVPRQVIAAFDIIKKHIGDIPYMFDMLDVDSVESFEEKFWRE